MLKTLVLLVLLAGPALAQYAPAPQQYSLAANNAGQVFHIFRDGQRALVDMMMPAGDGHPQIHVRTLVNIPTGEQLTWDLQDPSIPCGKGTASGWNDPFANYDQMMQSASGPPKKIGKETVNGFATTLFEVPSDGMRGKLWRDDKYGMVIKFAVAPPNGKAETMVDVQEFKVGKPDASVFIPPAHCAGK